MIKMKIFQMFVFAEGESELSFPQHDNSQLHLTVLGSMFPSDIHQQLHVSCSVTQIVLPKCHVVHRSKV